MPVCFLLVGMVRMVRETRPFLRGSVAVVRTSVVCEDPRSERVFFCCELVDEVACIAPEGEVGAYVGGRLEVGGVGVSAESLLISVFLVVAAAAPSSAVLAAGGIEGPQGDIGGLPVAASNVQRYDGGGGGCRWSSPTPASARPM